jgi:hypothetical protein
MSESRSQPAAIPSVAISAARVQPSRKVASQAPDIGRFRAQHLALDSRHVATETGKTSVMVDEHESPLAWLARRAGRSGKPLIAPHQLQAGERLRSDFTLALLTPRMTANWERPIAGGTRGPQAAGLSDTMIAARQRVHHALDAVGPEFSGLLLDVCCFLKGLEHVERERIWPARSAKIVLQLALERLARHYGYAAETRGRGWAKVRTWIEEGEAFRVE